MYDRQGVDVWLIALMHRKIDGGIFCSFEFHKVHQQY